MQTVDGIVTLSRRFRPIRSRLHQTEVIAQCCFRKPSILIFKEANFIAGTLQLIVEPICGRRFSAKRGARFPYLVNRRQWDFTACYRWKTIKRQVGRSKRVNWIQKVREGATGARRVSTALVEAREMKMEWKTKQRIVSFPTSRNP